MQDLQEAFSDFLNRTENFVDESMIPGRFSIHSGPGKRRRAWR